MSPSSGVNQSRSNGYASWHSCLHYQVPKCCHILASSVKEIPPFALSEIVGKPSLYATKLLFRTDSPEDNWCSIGTLIHISHHTARMINRYFHQDLHQRLFQPVSRQSLRNNPRALLHVRHFVLTVRYQLAVVMPSIFRASPFGRWVVTHSLADFNFHDHRPTVSMNQHLFWYLINSAWVL